MLYVCWLLKWLYILIVINFKPYYNAWYTYQYLHSKGAWQDYQGVKLLENCLSNSLVTVEGLKVDGEVVINIQIFLLLGIHVGKTSCLKPTMIFLFSNFLVATNFLVRKQSIFVGTSYKLNKQKIHVK